MSISSTFAAGHRREMVEKELPFNTGLPGFVMGMMMAHFQIDGKLASRRERLMRCMGYWTPAGPRCLRCGMLK